MLKKTHTDLIILGGGIAGLWLLARLRTAGYRAVLLEPDRLGAGQTRFSQGIIHGGTKYALTGEVGAAADAVAAMPGLWRACLAGDGEVDLRAAQVLAPNQYLWSTAGLGSRMAGFFASRLMRSRTRAAAGDDRPAVLRHPDFRGQVYRLDEPVLDTASLVRALAEPHNAAIIKVDWPDGVHLEGGSAPAVELHSGGRHLRLEAARLVLAAGAGNRDLLEALGRDAPAMQLRPLHMVMVRGPLPGDLFAHCLGVSANPRVTITSHRDAAGAPVWYLGGQLAEDGVGRSAADQIETARRELHELLPWVDFSACQWAALRVERAEPSQPQQRRPDGTFAQDQDGVIVSWPTKLALAPVLAGRIQTLLDAAGLQPGAEGEAPWTDWPHPDYAPLPWQEEWRWT